MKPKLLKSDQKWNYKPNKKQAEPSCGRSLVMQSLNSKIVFSGQSIGRLTDFTMCHMRSTRRSTTKPNCLRCSLLVGRPSTNNVVSYCACRSTGRSTDPVFCSFFLSTVLLVHFELQISLGNPLEFENSNFRLLPQSRVPRSFISNWLCRCFCLWCNYKVIIVSDDHVICTLTNMLKLGTGVFVCVRT